MVCRVLVNVALLLRTDSEDDSSESRGRQKEELYLDSCLGQIRHCERQLHRFVCEPGELTWHEEKCTWTLVPRTKVVHNLQSVYFCIQRIVKENVKTETSSPVNATCAELCWCWYSRILILHVIANWGRWFIMTGLAMFFQETPPRQHSRGPWYICNTFGNSMCPEIYIYITPVSPILQGNVVVRIWNNILHCSK